MSDWADHLLEGLAILAAWATWALIYWVVGLVMR